MHVLEVNGRYLRRKWHLMSYGTKTCTFHSLVWTFQRLDFSTEEFFSFHTCIYLLPIHCSTSSVGLSRKGCCILDRKLSCSCSLNLSLAHCEEIINSSCQFNSTWLLWDIQWFSTYFLAIKKQSCKLIMEVTNHVFHQVSIQVANKEAPTCLIFSQLEEMLVVHRKNKQYGSFL